MPSTRTDPLDRCPGVLRPHLAADGAMIRIRLRGGATSVQQLVDLAELAREFGSGHLTLTNRANLQLRGLADPATPSGAARLVELGVGIEALGLLPSPRHERVRNFLASPLDRSATTSLALAELDRQLCADAALAELPGRFLFAVDDGDGQVLRARPDLVLRAGHLPPEQVSSAVAGLLDQAHRFLRLRADRTPAVWRIAELPATERTSFADHPGTQNTTSHEVAPLPLGRLDDTTWHVAPWLGGLAKAQVADLPMTCAVALTQDRSLVLHDVPHDWRPDPALWLSQAEDSRRLLSACIGAPGCSQAAGSTHDYAVNLAAAGSAARRHVVGCHRACGAPSEPHELITLSASESYA